MLIVCGIELVGWVRGEILILLKRKMSIVCVNNLVCGFIEKMKVFFFICINGGYISSIYFN